MIFRANSLQPVAAATGVTSRVQLPAAGRLASNPLGLNRRQVLPGAAAAAMRSQARGHLSQQRTQHQVQCRANCLSKANF